MKLDKVTIETLQTVQHEIKNKHNVELSIEEVANIVDSQFIAANLAFKKRLGVRLPVIGSFTPKLMDATNIKMNQLSKEKPKLGIKEYLTRHKEIVNARIAFKKSLRFPKVKNLKELIKYVDIVKVKNKYDNVLENFINNGSK